jgi:hypothetical protein
MSEEQIDELKEKNLLGYLVYQFVSDENAVRETAIKARKLQQDVIDEALAKGLVSPEDVSLWLEDSAFNVV